MTATFNAYASTTTGQDVYVVGSIAALGGWDTAKAVKLSSSGYPIWSGAVSVPINTSFEYTYVKKDGSGNVTWDSGTNRSYTTASSSGCTADDTWR